MKKALIIGSIIVVIVLIGGYFYFSNSNQHSNAPVSPTPTTPVKPTVTTEPTSTIIPTPTPFAPDVSYCTPQELQAGIALEPAAGNVYGKITLKNISANQCQVIGNNFVVANYDTETVKNITIARKGEVELTLFTLVPNQTIYSQVHYPNGPQCSGPTQTAKVTFSYAMSPTASVEFANTNGETAQSIQVCTSASEQTTLDIWNVASQPIN